MLTNNPQRILRTGDKITTTSSEEVKIHYCVEKNGTLSFECLLGNTREVIAAKKGGAIIHIKPNQICFQR